MRSVAVKCANFLWEFVLTVQNSLQLQWSLPLLSSHQGFAPEPAGGTVPRSPTYACTPALATNARSIQTALLQACSTDLCPPFWNSFIPLVSLSLTRTLIFGIVDLQNSRLVSKFKCVCVCIVDWFGCSERGLAVADSYWTRSADAISTAAIQRGSGANVYLLCSVNSHQSSTSSAAAEVWSASVSFPGASHCLGSHCQVPQCKSVRVYAITGAAEINNGLINSFEKNNW